MVDNVIPIQDPTNYRRVRERIKKLWEKGEVEILHHARQRMIQRRLDITDVAQVVRYGQIVGHTKPKDLWRYTFEGKTVEGTKVKVIVEVNGSLIVVTVIK